MRLGRDPLFACAIMVPTDSEIARGISDIHLGDIPEDGFQGFPLRAARVVRRRRDPRRVAADLAACGFNAAALVGFCGANFTAEDIRSASFVALVRALKDEGLAVGVCLPFADTVDNTLTRADPRMHQLRWDGKRPFVRFDADLERPPYPLYIVDFGSAPFVRFARGIVAAARDAGADYIDYAEPDYWPTEGNGHDAYLEAAWRREKGRALPHPTTLEHRLFMEDWHMAALLKISAAVRRAGLQDHLTASPLGHAPSLICQNYGKYSRTRIGELSSTYHFSYGLALKERLTRQYGIDCAPHRISSLGCIEARSMRGWAERHATYLVPGQSLPASTYASALDQQMFLHNMDIVFWEYPSIRRNYYETTEAGPSPGKAWQALRSLFSRAARKYRALPADFHAAMPAPEALVYYSKRGAYVRGVEDRATPCACATALRLLLARLQPFFLFAEDMSPLEGRGAGPRLLIIDEHHPIPPGGWETVQAWLARGNRVVVYGGGPGASWENGDPQAGFPAAFSRLFRVRTGSRSDGLLEEPTPEELFPVEVPLPSTFRPLSFSVQSGVVRVAKAGHRPLASLRRLPGGSLAVYVAAPLCELPGGWLAALCGRLLTQTGGRVVQVDGPLDVEHCLYRAPGKRWLAMKNHSTESRTMTFAVATGFRPSAVQELLSGRPVVMDSYAAGTAAFRDTPGPNSIGIYELAR